MGKKRFKTITVIASVVTIAICAAFILYASGFFKKEPVIEVVPANGRYATLKVVTDQSYKPYSYMDKNNVPTGHDVEVLYYIANILNMSLEITPKSWEEAVSDMEEGRADILLTCDGEDIREGKVPGFIKSSTIAVDDIAVFGKERVSSKSGLHGKRIGMKEEGNSILLLTRILPEDSPFLFSTYEEAFSALGKGRLDYVVARYSVGKAVLEKMGIRGIKSQTSLGICSECIGIARKGALSSQIEEAILQMNSDGSLVRFNNKWIPSFETPHSLVEWAVDYPWIFILLFLLLVLFLLSFFLSKARRSDIDNEIESQVNKRIIDRFAEKYDSIYLVDINDDKMEVRKRPTAVELKYQRGSSFSRFMDEYINKDVSEDDRSMMRIALKPETIRRRLSNSEAYDVRFKDISTGSPHWHIMNVSSLGEDDSQILLGFADRDEQIKLDYQHQIALEEDRKSEEKDRMENTMEEERYTFLINVAHELRTPLTLIMGPLNRMLKSDNLPIEFVDTIKRVQVQGQRMATLLNTILTTNRVQNGFTQVNLESINLGEWLKTVTEEYRDEAENHEMDIVLEHDPTIRNVMIDEDLCRIVIANMITNAIKHNQPGQPVTVTSKMCKDKQSYRISISDHGSGIGDIDPSKLFERFFKATKKKGYGIGLSYAKSIVEAHKGTVGAVNNKNEAGATFWFELPIYPNIPENVSSRPEVDDSSVKEKSLLVVSDDSSAILSEQAKEVIKGRTLLFVEDDADLREYVKEEMVDLGMNVILAFNGRNALEKLRENEVDVVITDVMMPEMDGMELCRMIKNTPHFKDIPVVMLTARADEKSMKMGYDAKADYFMPKPFLIEDIEKVLKDVFSSI